MWQPKWHVRLRLNFQQLKYIYTHVSMHTLVTLKISIHNVSDMAPRQADEIL